MDGILALRFLALTCSLLAVSVAAHADEPSASREHPLTPAIKLASSSLETISEAKDYTAAFSKRELMGNQMVFHSMNVKIRHEPFSVYLRFQKPRDGREVIFVEGANGGNLLAHETGLASIVGTVSLSPKSREAMSESRYPITEMGIRTLVSRVIDQWTEESKYGECEVKYYPNAKLGTVECRVIESSHPRPRKQFRSQITRLYIEKESNLPVRVEHWAFAAREGDPPVLVEEYTYSNIVLDAGLTDVDFDTRNPNYGF